VSRTVLITPSWQVSIWNGVARLSESVAEALSMLGRDVIVITPAIPNGGAHRRWADGIQVLEVDDVPRGFGWRKNVIQALNTLRAIDEVVVIDSPAWHSCKTELVKLGVPVLGIVLFGQSIQGEKIVSPKTDSLIAEEDEFITDVSRVLVNNEVLRNRLNIKFERDIEKLEMVASPCPEIEVLESRPVAKQQGLAVVVGKIGPELGVEKIIRAMPDLKWLTLKIIGMPRSEWEMKRLTFLIERLELESRIEFLGYQKTRQTLEWIQAAEMLVAPSLVEYFGYSVMDAMLMRTAVVASTANVHIELIQDGDTGILFHNIDELKYALNSMHESSELRAHYIQASYKKVHEERSIKTMADSLADLVGV